MNEEEHNVLFKASNGYVFVTLSLALTLINIMIIAWLVEPAESVFVKFVLILMIIASYYTLAFITLRTTYFYENRIEIVYKIKFFGKKIRNKVIQYDEIEKAFIFEGPIRESPFLKIRRKNMTFPINIKYLNAEKIKILKDLLKNNGIKYKSF